MTNNKNWQKIRICENRSYQEKAFDTVNFIEYVSRENKTLITNLGKSYTEFISCSYLGLDQDKRITDVAGKDLDKLGFSFSVARTRAVVNLETELEELLRQIFFEYFPVIFQSTHMAIQGLIPLLASGEMPGYTLAKNGVHFILDKHVHSSTQINRGTMLQLGAVSVLSFSDKLKLRDTCKKAFENKQTPILFTDSINSMGGYTDVRFLIDLAEKFKGLVCFDDAHGLSVQGRNGAGFVIHEMNYIKHERVIIGTCLGKAFGGFSSVLLFHNKELQKFVKRFCMTYIVSGPIVNPILQANIASANIHLSPEITILQNKLWSNVRLFDTSYKNESINNNLPPI